MKTPDISQLPSATPLPVLFKGQQTTVDSIENALLNLNHRAAQLIGKVGWGKTFVYGQVVRDYYTKGLFDGWAALYPCIILVPATAISQISYEIYDVFQVPRKHVLITNYDQFRAGFGKMFVREKTEVKAGEIDINWEWYPFGVPRLIIFDESHKLKNSDSQQSKIFTALGNYSGFQAIHVSATPWTCIAEARTFCIHAKIPFTYGSDHNRPVDHVTWPTFAQLMCAHGTVPEMHSPKSVANLMEHIENYIHRIKGLRPKYHAQNQVKLIPFANPTDRLVYDAAYAEYLIELAKHDKSEPGGISAIWVAMLKFRQAAELLRAEIIADAAYVASRGGQAPVIALSFKATCAKVVYYLVTKHKVPRDKISMIWGGVSKKDLDDAKEEYQDLDLGTQTKEQRSEQIDLFQTGATDYCIFTFKAGGAALSLHHVSKHKGRSVVSKPRIGFLGPVYSAIELVQGLGRAPRLTSESDTPQLIIFFKDTIEEQVAEKVAIKLKCLDQVVGSRETWVDALAPNSKVSYDKNVPELPNADEAMEEELEGIFIEETEETPAKEVNQLAYYTEQDTHPLIEI